MFLLFPIFISEMQRPSLMELN